LGEPRFCTVAEVAGVPGGGPGNRLAAAVAAVAFADGAVPGGILSGMVWDVDDFREAEFFALVEGGLAGEHEHQRCV